MSAIRPLLLLLIVLLGVTCLGAEEPAQADVDPRTAEARFTEPLVARLADKDRGVRHAAVVALGQAGVAPEVLEPATEDAQWCVRAEALDWQRRLAVAGRGVDSQVDLSEVWPQAPVVPASSQEVRAAMAAIGEGGRDARIQAALDLARAPPEHRERALEGLRVLLKDPSWRVRMHAVEGLADDPTSARPLAAFLRSHNVALADAACRTLSRMGSAAASSTAWAMRSGHYGALHWGEQVFQVLRAEGAPGVGRLTSMLRDADVNVREVACVCLRHIGPAAQEATPALRACLADEHLCVIAEASLALGAVADPDALLDLLDHGNARVRGYGALALGGALGRARRIDHVPFQMRLPIEDPGWPADVPSADVARVAAQSSSPERLPILRRAIWSPDLDVALPAAAALTHEQVGLRDGARVMELCLPEAMRPGTPVNFDNLRFILSSDEVPAFVHYLVKTDHDEGMWECMTGAMHRHALPWHLPVLGWFERQYPETVTRHFGELHFSRNYSDHHRRLAAIQFDGRDPGADGEAILMALLEHALEDQEFWVGLRVRTPLTTLSPSPALASRLLDVALEAMARSEQGAPANRYAMDPLLAALGRAGTPEILSFLRLLREKRIWDVTAPLAQAGDATALGHLVADAVTDGDALVSLVAIHPDLGRRVLFDRLRGPDPDLGMGLLSSWSESATLHGVPLRTRHVLGWAGEAEDHLEEESFRAAQVVRYWPLCNTEELWSFVHRGIRGSDRHLPWDDDDLVDETLPMWQAHEVVDLLAHLHLLFPTWAVKQLEELARRGSDHMRIEALEVLARVAPQRIRTNLIEVLAEGDGDLLWLARLPPADIQAALDALESADGIEEHEVRDLTRLRCLAKGVDPTRVARAFDGGWTWPEDAPEEPLAEVARTGTTAEILAAMDALEARSSLEVYRDLVHRLQAGDRDARATLWAMQRQGRYGVLNGEDEDVHWLGRDLEVLPHWVHELESNCCRVSSGMGDAVFERGLDMPDLYGSENLGVGTSLTRRARQWLRLMGADFVWSPVADRWIRRPE